MSDHFAYLYEDDNRDFFQKTACELADSEIPAAADEFVKVAASRPGNVNTFEKVAARIEQDIFIIKTAGESGFNCGAFQRCLGYMNNLVDRVDMSPEQGAELFDKVAAAAIQHDIFTARAELYKIATEEDIPLLDAELGEVGVELVEAAQLYKEAFWGIIPAMGRAIKATKGLGLGTRVKAVAKAPGVAWRKMRAGRSVKAHTKASVKVRKARAKLQTVRKKQLGRYTAARAIADPGVRRSVMPSVRSKASAKITKQRKKVQKAEAKSSSTAKTQIERENLAAGLPAGTSVSAGFRHGGAAKKTQAVKTEQQAAKTDIGRQQAADKAGGAAKPKEAPKKKPDEPKAKDDVPENVAAGSAGEGVTLTAAASKLRDQGWSALSSAERQKLINVGAVTVIGGRVVLGKGIITGGEGLI